MTPGEKLALRFWLADAVAPAPDGWFCTHKDHAGSMTPAAYFIRYRWVGPQILGWGACEEHGKDLGWVGERFSVWIRLQTDWMRHDFRKKDKA